MKPTLILTLLVTCIFSCTTFKNNNFSRQKYTDFGHGKAVKFTGNNESRKISNAKTVEKESLLKTAVSEMALAEVVKDSTIIKDSLLPDREMSEASSSKNPRKNHPLNDDEDEVAPKSDSENGIIYAQQLKREARRNTAFGAGSILLGTGIFFLVPYALPILIALLVLGAVFFAVAVHKYVKKNDLEKDPVKYKNPKDEYIYQRKNQRLIVALAISGICTFLIAGGIMTILLLSIASAQLVTFILLTIGIILSGLIALTGLILLFIAAIKGRNHTRARRLHDEPKDMDVSILTPISWSIIAAAFISMAAWIGNIFTRP